MPSYYEYEEHIRQPRRRRDQSPPQDQYYGGGGDPRDSRDSFQRETMTLEPPPGYSHSSRPRSQPPPDSREVVPRGRSPSMTYDDDDYDEEIRRSFSRSRSRGARDESPMSRARSAVQDNFTNSTYGIGAGLLGAIAGGYAARQVSDRVSDRRRAAGGGGGGSGRRRRSEADTDDRIRLASTILGAAIGGLGANALTNRFEDSRAEGRAQQQAWEDKYGSDGEGDGYDDRRRDRDADYRSTSRGIKGRDDYYSDDDYDYVYDERDGRDRRYDDERRRPRRQDSDESYRRY